MTQHDFEQRIETYLERVRKIALQLHSDGVMSEHALGLAQQIADSIETKKAIERQRLTGGHELPMIGRKH